MAASMVVTLRNAIKLVMIRGYKVFTATDSSHGYSIANHLDCEITVVVGMHYGALTLDSIESENKR